jgi:aminopeptidase-like protein
MLKDEIYSWVQELYPLNRSIVGVEYDKSLDFLVSKMNLKPRILRYPSGLQAGTWTVPKGWSVNAAYIKRLNGEIVVDFRDSNLHVWSHSQPISGVVSRLELLDHLLTMPEQPTAIPYCTTYFQEKWGFSLTHEKFLELKDDQYEVLIDSQFYDHSLNVMELCIPGETKEEIFFTTYLCHPSMVNNELSGPAIMTALINFVAQKSRRYTFRFVIAPETIGPIFYLAECLDEFRSRTLMGWNITCVGDSKSWSLLESKDKDSVPSRISKSLLDEKVGEYLLYDFRERGSDERQYSSPKVGLPMVSIMRSKYTEFPEYHTSLDDLSLVTCESLFASYELYCSLIEMLDYEGLYHSNSIGEPFLLSFFHRTKQGGRFEGKDGDIASKVNQFVAYADGKALHEIALDLNISISEALEVAKLALDFKLVRIESFKPRLN